MWIETWKQQFEAGGILKIVHYWKYIKYVLNHVKLNKKMHKKKGKLLKMFYILQRIEMIKAAVSQWFVNFRESEFLNSLQSHSCKDKEND